MLILGIPRGETKLLHRYKLETHGLQPWAFQFGFAYVF